MTDEKKTLKFQMMMSPSEAQVLDDWMFRNRIRSRAEAIRRLTQIALAIEPMVDDLKGLWKQLAQADGDIGVAVLDAWSNLDTVPFEESLRRINSAVETLSAPALELGMEASKLETTFQSLKAGNDLEAALKEVEKELSSIDNTKAFIRKSWGPKEKP